MKKIFLVAVMAALFMGCAKDGKDGAPGPAGADGADGNANVVSSTITTSAWVYNAPSWVLVLNYPAITQNIVDKGAVLAYMKVGNNYAALPLTFYPTDFYSSSILYSYGVNNIAFDWTDSDRIQPNNPGSRTFKVVVIAASALEGRPDVDLLDYEMVKTAFDLKY
jgi:hypothetical protein